MIENIVNQCWKVADLNTVEFNNLRSMSILDYYSLVTLKIEDSESKKNVGSKH
jgi:hypothetical protein